MPANNTRDVAKAIARLRDDIRDLQEGNRPDEELAITRTATETATISDSTDIQPPNGDQRYLHYTTAEGAEILREQFPDRGVATEIGLAECGP